MWISSLPTPEVYSSNPVNWRKDKNKNRDLERTICYNYHEKVKYFIISQLILSATLFPYLLDEMWCDFRHLFGKRHLKQVFNGLVVEITCKSIANGLTYHISLVSTNCLAYLLYLKLITNKKFNVKSQSFFYKHLSG